MNKINLRRVEEMKKYMFVIAICTVLAGAGVLWYGKVQDKAQAVTTQAKLGEGKSIVSEQHTGQEDVSKAEVSRKAAKLHIPFIANEGQADEGVKFYAPTFGGTVFVTDEGEIVYSLPKFEEKEVVKGEAKGLKPTTTAILALKEELVGGKVEAVRGEGEAVTKVSYFRGNDQSKWKSGIGTYDIVSLGEVYEGIELKLKAYGNNVEKLFYVSSGAEPEKIKVKLNGGKGLSVNKEGELEVQTELGAVKFTKPVAFQEVGGKKEPVEVAYAVEGDEYGFEVGKYDETKELVIDPILAATFLGGIGNDSALDIVLNNSGDVYVGGFTSSPNFPGIGPDSPDDTFRGGSEGFVAKLDSDLSSILAATFLGGSMSGSSFDGVFGIALDDAGDIYVTGSTTSANFPGIGAGSADNTFSVSEAFVVKFNPDLSSILAATFLGGSGDGIQFRGFDSSFCIIIDSANNIYVGGDTGSADFPSVGAESADNTLAGNTEAFVAKLNSDLSEILAATFLGGSSADGGCTVAVDSLGNVYTGGSTSSADFPGVNVESADSTFAGSEAFVAKLNSDLSEILAATFLGGSGFDGGSGIVIDSSGDVYAAGGADSFNFPGVGAGSADSTIAGESEAFIAKLDSDLREILAATFLGGSGSDDAHDIDLDGIGNVYITSGTGSPDFPGIGEDSADSTFDGLGEAFVVKLNPELSEILAATFLGGFDLSRSDGAIASTIDDTGNIYVIGGTGSSDFPGVNSESADSTFMRDEAFVVKLDSDLSLGCDRVRATIFGTPGNDVISGTNGRDVIHGLGGDDTINGLDGRDMICGGSGNDIIDGGRADDRIFGEEGNDRINGSGGNDILRGEMGRDTMSGGPGNDQLLGGANNDTLRGNNGDDDMDGVDGVDLCDGGSQINGDTAIRCETVVDVP